MVGGVVITGIVILFIFLIAALINILYVSKRSFDEEPKAFTVLVYHKNDDTFDSKLLSILSQLRWVEPCFYSDIYVVHMNVPDVQSVSVREICTSRQNLIYISIDEFINMMCIDKNSLERDCNLSEKVV